MAGAPYAAGGIRVDDRGHPRGVRRRARARSPRARRARGAARRHHARSRSSPATASTSTPSERSLRGRRRAAPTTSRSSAPTSCPPSTRAAPTTTSSSSAARCSPPARRTPAGSTCSARSGAFDADQSRAVLEAGRAAGLGLRVHANQLGPGPGVRLAVELGAASADHCTYLTDADVDALAGGDTVATFLPGDRLLDPPALPRRPARASTPAPRSPSRPTATPARATRRRWRSASRSPCATCGMTVEEALLAATLGGARALRRDDVGRLAPGRARRPRRPRRARPTPTSSTGPGVPLVAATMVAGRPGR